jgi:hypothetical protein
VILLASKASVCSGTTQSVISEISDRRIIERDIPMIGEQVQTRWQRDSKD